MKDLKKRSNRNNNIPIISDVVRNIDGYKMVRCSYFTIQSDEPLFNCSLKIGNLNYPILLLNLEAIILGSPNNPFEFKNMVDINEMYEFIEEGDLLFVDINDIWIPIEWFGEIEIKQGMVFRIPGERFSICWRLRHDKISIEEMFSKENIKDKDVKINFLHEPPVRFSEKETQAFNQWTNLQIEQSRKRYEENRNNTLKKIK